jgi:DNA-directed RNA polymerase specialized sigma24 family protein
VAALVNNQSNFKIKSYLNNYNSKLDIAGLIRQRDPKGYKLLYKNYSAVLFGTIIRIITDKAIAGDVLNEVFEKICNNIDQYRADQLKFLTWILQLARSVSVDYLCVVKDQSITGGFFENQKAAISVIGNIELVMMPVNDEVGIINMVLQGYKAEEIAQKLNMAVGAVKINIRKGMKLKANRI